jgi:molecular chaperone DnaK
MTKIIGIDFGTKNSVVAVMNGDTPVLVPSAEGNHFCPAVVAFTKKGAPLIGRAAERQAIGNPENTIVSVKHLLGRRIDEAETRRIGDRAAYQIVADPARNSRRNGLPTAWLGHAPNAQSNATGESVRRS